MDADIADILRELTKAFYERASDSFSRTRRAPWPGWRACREAIDPALRGGAAARGRGALLDLACGNLRFEALLAADLDVPVGVVAVDSCASLASDESLPVGGHVAVDLRVLDAVAALAPGAARPLGALLADAAPPGSFDAAVSFGFLHHVPGAHLRAAALSALAGAVRSGGVVAVSLWRFLDDPAFAARADTDHARLAARFRIAPDRLEPGDRLLGWGQDRTLARYCHSFSDADEQALAASLAPRADLVDRFRSDGRTGASNAYLVFRVR